MRLFFTILLPVLFASPALHAQFKWAPYAGINATMDAEGFYAGPSFLAGVDLMGAGRIYGTFYGHYFGDKDVGVLNDVDNVTWRGRIVTVAPMGALRISRKWNKGFHVGLGVCYQRRSEVAQHIWGTEKLQRDNIMAALRIGYNLPVWGNNNISFDINATGPRYFNGEGSMVEVITLLSAGCRFVFRRGRQGLVSRGR